MNKTKIVAAITAAVCMTAWGNMFPISVRPLPATVMTANAVDAEESTDIFAEPGIYAEDYSYAYADTLIYTHTISAVTIKIKNEDGSTTDYSTWEDADGYTYGIYKIAVSTKVEGKTTVVDTQYRVGIVSAKNTLLNLTACNKVSVPTMVTSYVASEFSATILDTTKSTVVGPNAFASSYAKTIDLEGVVYIGSGAFSKCTYITEITIPDTTLFVGSSAFSGSGLKTLHVNMLMPTIPDSLCANTKLSEITFAYNEQIRYIGASAFKGTPLKVPFYESWSDTDTRNYEYMKIGDSAFEGCTSITSLNFPGNVVGIGKSSFKGCSSVGSLVFGQNVLYADVNCFADCTALTDITFNDVLSSLGGGVFSGCTSLKKVPQMPNTLNDWVAVTSSTGYGFGNNMFANCTSLTEVSLPTSITKIPDSVFAGCTALNYVYNSDNIVAIGKSSFNGCTNLLEAVFPNVTSIGDGAFTNCSKLKTFEVADCSEVGDSALQGCSSLTNITLKADTYGDYAFKGCSSLTKITLTTSGMTKTPVGLFADCTKLATIDCDLSDVTIVSDYSFSGCKALKELSLPSMVIIETSAFYNCAALEKVCDDNITAEDFGSKCFFGCTSLKQAVNSKASTISASAFQKSGITKLTLEGTVGTTMVIGNSAFADCENLETVDINAGTNLKYSVGTGVFANCPKLNDVVYTGPAITKDMFKSCAALTTVKSHCTSVEDGGFSGCESLTTIKKIATPAVDVLFASVGSSAFKDCRSLLSTHTDATTTFTGTAQFENCASITQVDTSVLTNNMFSGCSGLVSANINGLTVIPDGAFMNCTSLTDIDLSDVLTVGAKSFMGSGLKTLTIDNAQTMGTSAFSGCKELTTINVAAESIGNTAFSDASHIENATIYAKTIGASAFSNCASLRKVNLQTSDSRTLESIGSKAFDNCSVLLEIVIPGSPTMGSKCVGYVNGKANAEFLLVGESGSTVEEYATANKLAFCDINDFDWSEREAGRNTPGDVDGNGLVTVVDAVKLQNWLLGRDTPGIVGNNMDLDSDGSVNVFDLVALKQKLTGRV